MRTRMAYSRRKKVDCAAGLEGNHVRIGLMVTLFGNSSFRFQRGDATWIRCPRAANLLIKANAIRPSPCGWLSVRNGDGCEMNIENLLKGKKLLLAFAQACAVAFNAYAPAKVRVVSHPEPTEEPQRYSSLAKKNVTREDLRCHR